MKNAVLAKIKSGEKAIGMFCELGGTAAAECLGLAGLDFFIIDCEHGPFDVESAQLAILAGERRGCTPFARAKDCSRASLLKLLDVGAMGLIVPFVHSVADASELVRYAKYRPLGERGFAHARVSGFGRAPYAREMRTHLETANRETLLIPQCETVGCLEHIEEIAALPGIDGIFVGPYDLSIALGIPGEFQNPAFLQAVERVRRACAQNGKLSFIFTGSGAQAREYFRQGFDAVAAGLDAMLLIEAVEKLVKEAIN